MPFYRMTVDAAVRWNLDINYDPLRNQLWDTFLSHEGTISTMTKTDGAPLFLSVVLLTDAGWPQLDIGVSWTTDGPTLSECELDTIGFDINQSYYHSEMRMYPNDLFTLIEGGLTSREDIVSAEQHCGRIHHLPEHLLPPHWERRLDGEQSYFVNLDDESMWAWEPPAYITLKDTGGKW